ncbi:hypothetical protein [Methanolapillus africanus]|uniref:hypothetical protein n=1 Tax=Methanolapillus africanus TaxID=3028297 RepID=UPI0030B8C161
MTTRSALKDFNVSTQKQKNCFFNRVGILMFLGAAAPRARYGKNSVASLGIFQGRWEAESAGSLRERLPLVAILFLFLRMPRARYGDTF